jgi:hypothetical protein
MAQLILNVGTTNNDKTGDTLRAGGLKIKSNFAEIYNALSADGLNISGGNLLKTGGWSDVRNKPNFHAIATSGSFNDLEYKPDFALVTSVPNNTTGHGGEMTGNIAFDGTNLYVAIADYDGETEIWKSIPGGGGSSGNTGDVTFTDNIVQGTGYELSLSPGTSFTDGSYTDAPGPQLGPQYFRFRGGDNYEHLHFDTSNNSAFDLYVGDDSKYFKLSKDGQAVIGTNGSTWIFGLDGRTTIPHGINGPSTARGSAGDTAGTILVSGAYLFYCYADYTDGSTPIWQKVSMDNTDWD